MFSGIARATRLRRRNAITHKEFTKKIREIKEVEGGEGDEEDGEMGEMGEMGIWER